MKFQIAVVQFQIEQYFPLVNLTNAERFIEQASSEGANVIIFPEDFITGPVASEENFVDFENKYLNILQTWSRQYSIDIVTGSIIEGEKNGWFNTTYYIDAEGNIVGKYKKINLWHPEREYLSPGDKVVTFQTKYGKAGLIICWDIIFPEIFREMIRAGVEIIYCPSYWALEDAGWLGLQHNKNSEIELVNALSVARALENEVIFVYANAAGSYNIKGYSGTLIGQSQVAVPFKGVLKRLAHNRQEMFIQEVDTDILVDAESVYRIRADLKLR